jgi:hypothetical protein
VEHENTGRIGLRYLAEGVPSGKVSNARCCNSSDGIVRTADASLGGIEFISHPSGSGAHNSVDESVRR